MITTEMLTTGIRRAVDLRRRCTARDGHEVKAQITRHIQRMRTALLAMRDREADQQAVLAELDRLYQQAHKRLHAATDQAEIKRLLARQETLLTEMRRISGVSAIGHPEN